MDSLFPILGEFLRQHELYLDQVVFIFVGLGWQGEMLLSA
jgi:hypothetical protein